MALSDLEKLFHVTVWFVC